MDTTALSLCMDNGLPIYVFALEPGNIRRVVPASGSARSSRPLDRGGQMTIDDLIQDATRRMDKSVEARTDGVQHRPHRPRLGGAARPRSDRLLRAADAAQAARDDQRPRAALLTIQPFDPSSVASDREGDPGVRPRPHAVERRQDHPPADPAADRGAAQGARQGRPPPGGGRDGRRAQRAPRRRCTT